MSVAQDDDQSLARGRGGSLAGRAALRVTGVVLGGALLVGAGWWATHPGAFGAVGNELGMQVPVGRSALAGMIAVPRTPVTVVDVAPRVGENTADADVEVLLCRTGPGEGVGAFTGDPADVCEELVDPRGRTIPPVTPQSTSELVIVVTPRSPGEVAVDGVDVRYRAGLRWGSQETGIVVRVTATEGSPTR